MAHRARTIPAALVALTVVVLGAPAAGAAASGPVPVDVMVIADSTGAFPFLSGIEHGVRAGAKAVNKGGKVKVNVEVCDSGGDQNRAAACARRAVDEEFDAVFALTLTQGSSILPVLEDANVPAFWGATIPLPGQEGQDNSEISMLPTSPTLAGYGAMGVGAAVNGLKNAVVVDSTIAEGVSALVQKGYKNSGGKLVGTESVPFVPPGTPGAVDPAPYAQAIATKKPGSVLLVSAAVNYVQPLREAGVDAPLVLLDSSDPAELNDPLDALPAEITKNVYKTSANPPFDATTPSPVVKRFAKELKASGATKASDLDPYAWATWNGIHALAEVAATMPTVDAASLLAALNSAKDVKLPTGRTWTPSAPGPTGYSRDSTAIGYVSKYAGNGKWKLAKPGPNGILMEPKLFN